MKIAHVVNTTTPGGAEKQLAQLVRRSAFEHQVIALGASGGARSGVVRDLRDALRDAHADVVVAWLERPQLAVAAAAPRQPRVAAIRGLPRRAGAGAVAVRAALTRFDCLVSNSDASRRATESFLRPFRARRFEVVPNGIDDEGVLPQVDGATFRAVFIGRDDPAKGLDVLLAAARLLPQHVELVLVGAGVPAAVERAGVETRCVTLDRTPGPWEAIGHADLLIVPSLSEGSPNVVLEAFVRGVPVIGTDAGGLPELLAGGRGVIVPAGDPDALAQAVSAAAAGRDEARRMADRARKFAERVHSWDRAASAYDNLFLRLAEG